METERKIRDGREILVSNCMEYGRCQNGMKDFKNGMEDNL